MHHLQLRWVAIVWVGILAVISVRVLIKDRANSVYPIFSDAGRKWLEGSDLYGQPSADSDVFRYCPAVAAGFAALSRLPDAIGGVLWRWINAAVFVGALAFWCRTWQHCSRGLRPRPQTAAVFMLVLPLAIGGLNNGQCNALVAGLLLIAAVAFGRCHWMLAATAVTTAGLFKVYPLALGLLFCLLEPRRFTPGLCLALLIGFALPYLFQHPDYVTTQYTALAERLQDDDRTIRPIHAGYRDLHLLLRRAGWHTSLPTYRLIEVVAGLACAAIVLSGRRRGWDRRQTVDVSLTLCLIWMTLFGPATESCTYVLLAPVLARVVVTAETRPWPQRLMVHSSFGLFTLGAMIVWFPRWIADPVQTAGVQPLAACLLLADVLLAGPQPQAVVSTSEADPPTIALPKSSEQLAGATRLNSGRAAWHPRADAG